MTIDVARATIIRKFTNHRNHDLAGIEKISDVKMYNALKEAATALVDFKAFSKGKALFKQRNMEAIISRRNDLYNTALAEELDLPLVAAFQKALKQLWNSADQDYWDQQAVDEPEDVHM